MAPNQGGGSAVGSPANAEAEAALNQAWDLYYTSKISIPFYTVCTIPIQMHLLIQSTKHFCKQTIGEPSPALQHGPGQQSSSTLP